jgi:phosphoribosylanthranilate isomerase
MRIKICGITSLEDALAAVEAGADWLGFNFYPPSPRFVPPEVCAKIVASLRGTGVTCVGVFVNAPLDEIQAILEVCRLDLAQLSGDEPPEVVNALGERAFKALRPASSTELEALLRRYPPRREAPAWLLDAYRPGEYGGTGAPASRELARALAGQAPILLAGGLRPENVGEAIRQVRPWGVDVASGVESSPPHKDALRMKQFIQAARMAATEGTGDLP